MRAPQRPSLRMNSWLYFGSDWTGLDWTENEAR